MKKIIIFGGTFDPIHKGHLKMAKYAMKTLNADKLFFVINTKSNIKDSPVASYEEREKMLRLAIRNFSHKKYRIDKFEKNNSYNNEPNYTIDTVKYFKDRFSNDEIYLLIGDDQYLKFNQWKDHQKIRDYVKILVSKRYTSNVDKQDKDDIFLKNNPVDVCSTQIRNGKNDKMLPKNVKHFIDNNFIYLETKIKSLMSEKRFEHTQRVVKTAIEIAKANNYKDLNKVKIAALCHDVAKEFKIFQIVQYLSKNEYHGYEDKIHIFHGLVGSRYVKKEFKIKDKEILDAIANHVIPNASNASKLTKILYLADKLEPSRTINDIDNRKFWLEKAMIDLNESFEHVLKFNQNKYINGKKK